MAIRYDPRVTPIGGQLLAQGISQGFSGLAKGFEAWGEAKEKRLEEAKELKTLGDSARNALKIIHKDNELKLAELSTMGPREALADLQGMIQASNVKAAQAGYDRAQQEYEFNKLKIGEYKGTASLRQEIGKLRLETGQQTLADLKNAATARAAESEALNRYSRGAPLMTLSTTAAGTPPLADFQNQGMAATAPRQPLNLPGAYTASQMPQARALHALQTPGLGGAGARTIAEMADMERLLAPKEKPPLGLGQELTTASGAVLTGTGTGVHVRNPTPAGDKPLFTREDIGKRFPIEGMPTQFLVPTSTGGAQLVDASETQEVKPVVIDGRTVGYKIGSAFKTAAELSQELPNFKQATDDKGKPIQGLYVNTITGQPVKMTPDLITQILSGGLGGGKGGKAATSGKVFGSDEDFLDWRQ